MAMKVTMIMLVLGVVALSTDATSTNGAPYVSVSWGAQHTRGSSQWLPESDVIIVYATAPKGDKCTVTTSLSAPWTSQTGEARPLDFSREVRSETNPSSILPWRATTEVTEDGSIRAEYSVRVDKSVLSRHFTGGLITHVGTSFLFAVNSAITCVTDDGSIVEESTTKDIYVNYGGESDVTPSIDVAVIDAVSATGVTSVKIETLSTGKCDKDDNRDTTLVAITPTLTEDRENRKYVVLRGGCSATFQTWTLSVGFEATSGVMLRLLLEYSLVGSTTIIPVSVTTIVRNGDSPANAPPKLFASSALVEQQEDGEHGGEVIRFMATEDRQNLRSVSPKSLAFAPCSSMGVLTVSDESGIQTYASIKGSKFCARISGDSSESSQVIKIIDVTIVDINTLAEQKVVSAGKVSNELASWSSARIKSNNEDKTTAVEFDVRSSTSGYDVTATWTNGEETAESSGAFRIMFVGKQEWKDLKKNEMQTQATPQFRAAPTEQPTQAQDTLTDPKRTRFFPDDDLPSWYYERSIGALIVVSCDIVLFAIISLSFCKFGGKNQKKSA